MSSYAGILRATPVYRVSGRIRELAESVLVVVRPQPGQTDAPTVFVNRHEALIHAARTAFGGTIDW